MKYRNVKTGMIIESSSKIAGDNWEEVGVAKNVTTTVKMEETVSQMEIVQKESDKPSSGKEFDAITVKEIKQELDAFGIKYDKNAKKQVLFDLMMQGK